MRFVCLTLVKNKRRLNDFRSSLFILSVKQMLTQLFFNEIRTRRIVVLIRLFMHEKRLFALHHSFASTVASRKS